LLIGVHLLAELLRRLRQHLSLGVDAVLVLRLQRFLGVFERASIFDFSSAPSLSP